MTRSGYAFWAVLPVLVLFFVATPCRAGFLDTFSDMTGMSSDDAVLGSDRYDPQTQDRLSAYKGKEVRLTGFENNAQNTKQFSYPSYDERLWYRVGHGSVEGYFWYCWEKALGGAGALVYEKEVRAEVPRVGLNLLYLTDKAFRGRVTVSRPGVSFSEVYEFTWTPPSTEDREKLAQSQFRFMDHITASIWTDAEFKAAFFK
ncbi:MAG: hypothetical protein ACLFOY_05625 [Desulfatibacillaceae bacterium]